MTNGYWPEKPCLFSLYTGPQADYLKIASKHQTKATVNALKVMLHGTIRNNDS